MCVCVGGGGGGWSLFCNAVLSVLSSFAIISPRKKELVTAKLVLNGHSKIDKTKILMITGSLIKAESIAECSPWSNLQYF